MEFNACFVLHTTAYSGLYQAEIIIPCVDHRKMDVVVPSVSHV